MNLIHCLDQDLHENSLDVILGLGSSNSSYSADYEREYDFGSGSKNCETYAWIWQDDNQDIQSIQKCSDIEMGEMKQARVEQQNRINQYLAWAVIAIPSNNQSSSPKSKRRIRKINKNKK